MSEAASLLSLVARSAVDLDEMPSAGSQLTVDVLTSTIVVLTSVARKSIAAPTSMVAALMSIVYFNFFVTEFVNEEGAKKYLMEKYNRNVSGNSIFLFESRAISSRR